MLLGIIALACLQQAPVFEPGTRVLAGDGAAGEGPAWHPTQGVFTSGRGGICRLTPKGESVLHRPNAGTNGLLFDRDGSLLACEPVLKRVTRTKPDGTLVVLTDSFAGKPYNQPNDLTVDAKGRIYFSDPRYGPRDGMEQRDSQGRTIEGVYRIDPDGKVTRVIGREVQRANGVLVSLDGKHLFVAFEVMPFDAVPVVGIVRIEVDARTAPADAIERLRRICEEYHGDHPVVVDIRTTGGQRRLRLGPAYRVRPRSEEHTSELQSH